MPHRQPYIRWNVQKCGTKLQVLSPNQASAVLKMNSRDGIVCKQRWSISVINYPSTAASTANLINHFVTVSDRLCRVKLTTRCKDRRAVAELFKSKVSDKVPEKSTLTFE